MLWAYPSIEHIRQYASNYGTGDKGLDFGGFNILAFSRLLAKIGHGFAYVNRRGKFRPLLRDFILSEAKVQPRNYIGGEFIDYPPGRNLHDASLVGITAPSGISYLVCKIRLFAQLGAPQYHVVVGENI
jgi:hypothetical protein